MKITNIATIVFTFVCVTATFGQENNELNSEKQNAIGQPQVLTEEIREEVELDWKEWHEGRMKQYEQVAESLERITKLSDEAKIIEAVKLTATKLPLHSNHAIRLRELVSPTGVSKGNSNSDVVAKSQEEIKSELNEIAAQLAFRPTIEAEMPEGFPPPTPVGEIEIKLYPAHRLARTTLEKEVATDKVSSSFLRLFNHIQTNEIPMTTPVQMVYKQAKSGVDTSTMAFLYGDKGAGTLQNDGQVHVIDAAQKRVIAMGLRGRPEKDRIELAVAQLRSHATRYAAQFELSKEIRVMGYNGPSVPDADQFFEVQLELKSKPAKL